MQAILNAIFPPQCAGCDDPVMDQAGLCPKCWRRFHFVVGAKCDCCGLPLQGDDDPEIRCEDCINTERPWGKGRSVFHYSEGGREFILRLKHGDRLDLMPSAGHWMARFGEDLWQNDTVLVPVPLHRWRLMRRKYNQSAVLAQRVSKVAGLDVCVDALLRTRATQTLDGLSRDARFAMLDQSITLNPRRMKRIEGRSVVLIDDVMTSGATFTACTHAILQANPRTVNVLSLARVGKDT